MIKFLRLFFVQLERISCSLTRPKRHSRWFHHRDNLVYTFYRLIFPLCLIATINESKKLMIGTFSAKILYRRRSVAWSSDALPPKDHRQWNGYPCCSLLLSLLWKIIYLWGRFILNERNLRVFLPRSPFMLGAFEQEQSDASDGRRTCFLRAGGSLPLNRTWNKE